MQVRVVPRLRRGPGPEARRAPAGPPPSRWTVRAIRDPIAPGAGLTLSGVWRARRRLGLGLRAAAVQRYRPAPDYSVKEAHLLAVLREAAAAPDEVVARFRDEMGYARWPDPAPDWGPVAPAPRPVAGRAGSKQRLWRVIGALNARTGQVAHRDNSIVGREQLSGFYRHLDAASAAARRVYRIQDTWSIHAHPDVLATLATLPRLEPVWRPTYAPWLNPIEKLWRWLTGAVLRQHRLAADWAALRGRVTAFLDQFAAGSSALLRYVGLLGDGKLAQACRSA